MVQLKYGKWQFPQVTKCPVVGCRDAFESRFDAMLHYKQHHAMEAILCNFCAKPIRIDCNKDGFVRHFQRLHPNQKIPYGLDTKSYKVC